MKLTAQVADLAQALSMVALGVMKKTAGLSAVHILAANGEVSLASTFLELAVAAKAVATIVEPGKTATSALPLIDLIASLSPSATVTLSATDTWISVTCGNHRSRLVTVPWADLPSMIDIDNETDCVEISGADCLTLLEPLPAAVNERSRLYLCGIHIAGADGRIGACATDGVRMIVTGIEGAFSEGTSDLIVPREGAAALQKLIKATKPEKLTLRRSKRLIGASCAQFSFVSKLVDAQYPDIRPVIPPPSRNTVTCQRGHLIGAMRSLDAVACLTDKAPYLMLYFDGVPKLNSSLARAPQDGFDMIAAEITGIGRAVVQLRLLLEMLGQVSSETIRIEFTPDRPLRICSTGAKLVLLSQCRWDFKGDSAPPANCGVDVS